MTAGSLDVVGLGIRTTLVCPEARACIEVADKVFYLVADPISYLWLISVNPNAESLHTSYREGEIRMKAYLEMIDRILNAVRSGNRVCVVSYGHPGVFAFPMHESIRRAREEGFPSKMVPGVSAEDCLFADLGVDPGRTGCQSFEATDFLIYRRRFDPSCTLVLWQIGVIGNLDFQKEYETAGLAVLTDVLCQYYPRNHEVTIYEAASLPGVKFSAETVPLFDLASARVNAISTLLVPPVEKRAPDAEMMTRLHIMLPQK